MIKWFSKFKRVKPENCVRCVHYASDHQWCVAGYVKKDPIKGWVMNGPNGFSLINEMKICKWFDIDPRNGDYSKDVMINCKGEILCK